MKKVLLILIALLNVGLMSLHAQIVVRENAVIERAISKPRQFDSLSNITLQRNLVDYKKYIGYKLFYLPKAKNYKPQFKSQNKEVIDFLFSKQTASITKGSKMPFEKTMSAQAFGNLKGLNPLHLAQYNEQRKLYEKVDKTQTNIYLPYFYHERTDEVDGRISGAIGTMPDSVFGKYFTILDIQGKDPQASYDDKSLDNYKSLESIDLNNGNDWQVLGLKLTLRNESNKDTLYWVVNQARSIGAPFFLVPYFEKQRSLYVNKNIMLKSNDVSVPQLENLIDVNTGAITKIKYGEVWTCSDISFVDSKDSYYLNGFYFLKNGDREVKLELNNGLVQDYFMLESDYKKQQAENKKKEEQRQKEQQEQEKKARQESVKFRSDCIAQWGQKMGSYIADGKVMLGMNKQMCTAAWGSPIAVNRTTVKGLTAEQWVYGWGTYLYFGNGTLNAIQD
ncbi:hypothetical protein [Hymenobacter rigui]|uniref:Uncharacterized protein n=1 Tax=Hymenobacter rigui TaxID=334424 RepID=A0A428KLB9_9BACT|nr:hypothetical protein [Hymenobacter rigui]RSK47193.1 hypothetical protein EI291_16510 [Hymenobacter rigui]